MPQLGDGRGTAEEAELGLPGYKNGFGLRGRSAQLHDHDHSCSNRRGHRCVHDDAQLAVIGICLVGMQVRNLGHGQNRQQDEAQGRNHRQKADAAAIPEPL